MLKTSKNKVFPKALMLFTTLALLSFSYLIPAYAQPTPTCPPNVVPNPLDPNCAAQNDISIGALVNRVIVFIPFFLGMAVVAAFLFGIFKIAFGGEEGREEGIKWMINAFIAVVAMGLLWVILFILSIFTGVDLLSAIGQ